MWFPWRDIWTKKYSSILGNFAYTYIIYGLFGYSTPKPISSPKDNKDITYKDIRIAFVNEDLGYTYNDDDIHLAGNLINRFIEDNDYNIELVSRSIAENRLKKWVL